MNRGKEDRIVITKAEGDKKIEVIVEGLWTGKDRIRIGRILFKAMRTATYKEKLFRKQADLKVKEEEQGKVDIKQGRLDALTKARAAKKLKKLEGEKKNVRGQRKRK